MITVIAICSCDNCHRFGYMEIDMATPNYWGNVWKNENDAEILCPSCLKYNIDNGLIKEMNIYRGNGNT